MIGPLDEDCVGPNANATIIEIKMPDFMMSYNKNVARLTDQKYINDIGR